LTRIAFRIVQLTSSNAFLRSCIGRAKCCLVECLLHDVNQLCMHMNIFKDFSPPLPYQHCWLPNVLWQDGWRSSPLATILLTHCFAPSNLKSWSISLSFVQVPLSIAFDTGAVSSHPLPLLPSSLSHCPSPSGGIDAVLEQIDT
jgi:hypothetical protein